MKITILGNGIFGSAITSYLSKRGHHVVSDVIENSEIIFICATSNLVLPSLLKLQKEIMDQKIVICSKGFAEGGKLISEILKENFKNEIFFLSGPTLAEELNKEVPSGMVLAGGKGKEEIKKIIESENLHIELSDDVIGVEISATLKNVMSIFIGIAQGAGYGQNTSAFIFTKAAQEMKNIGIALGAKEQTFLGLSCIGDLFLSSRNRLFGIELGRGHEPEEIIAEIKHTPAGVFDIKDAQMMVKKLNINAPIINSLYKIIVENYPARDTIKEILNS